MSKCQISVIRSDSRLARGPFAGQDELHAGLSHGRCRVIAIETLDTHPMRQVVISRGQDGFWVAECPSLPGCVSQGRTRDEAIANIKEAIEAYVAALTDDGLPVPQDTLDTTIIAV